MKPDVSYPSPVRSYNDLSQTLIPIVCLQASTVNYNRQILRLPDDQPLKDPARPLPRRSQAPRNELLKTRILSGRLRASSYRYDSGGYGGHIGRVLYVGWADEQEGNIDCVEDEGSKAMEHRVWY